MFFAFWGQPTPAGPGTVLKTSVQNTTILQETTPNPTSPFLAPVTVDVADRELVGCATLCQQANGLATSRNTYNYTRWWVCRLSQPNGSPFGRNIPAVEMSGSRTATLFGVNLIL